MDITTLRHPKERRYRIFCIALTVLCLPLILVFSPFLIFYVIMFAIGSWLTQQWATALILGHCVRVSEQQLPAIHTIVADVAKQMKLTQIPEVYIIEDRDVNAFALRFVSKRYVFLTGTIIDIMSVNDRQDELKFIIGHEFAHHVLGHTNPWFSLLISPSHIVPFLGTAYSRACELSCDRVAFMLTACAENSLHALANLSVGSTLLAGKVNIDVFMEQENSVPKIMGFIANLFSTHPRTTVRLIELKAFAAQNTRYLESNYQAMTSGVTAELAAANSEIKE